MKTASFFVTVFTVASLRAATFDVTSIADSGPGSLRDQVAAATSGDTIRITATGLIYLSTGEILVKGKNLTIAGPGANVLTVTTTSASRALHIINAECAITGIAFDNCKAIAGDIDTGGAIAVDNFTAGGDTNVTTIANCAFSNNQSGWGGAVDIFHGGLMMNNCSFIGNSCTGFAFGTNGGGGALSIGPTVASTVTNCTFSGNVQSGTVAGRAGGAVYNYGAVPTNPPPVTIEHCSFIGNIDSSGGAGAIRGNYTGSYHTFATLRNCLLSRNQAPAEVLRNFSGNPTGLLSASYNSLGGNVTDENDTSAQFMPAGSDKTNCESLADSILPAPALNGGTTLTHAILRGSPAQGSSVSSVVTTDQRGARRHSVADSGAYELIEPELSVSVNGVQVGGNGFIDFGRTPFDMPSSVTVTITNTESSNFASGPLTLSIPALAVSATDPALPTAYAITDVQITELGSGDSATFDITLLSSLAGSHGGFLSFSANDRLDSTLATNDPGALNTHSFQLIGLVTDTADHWREQNFGPGATNSGPAADDAAPAGDGMSNLLKYSLGLNPHVAYPPGFGLTADIDAEGHLRLSVAKNPAATDVFLSIETSGDLSEPSTWNSAGTTVERETDTLLQARDNVSVSAAKARFIRLKVNRQ